MFERIRKSNIQSAACAALLSALATGVAQADCSHGYFCQGVIQTMTVVDDAVYISLVGGTTGLTNCTPYSSIYFTLPRSNPNYQAHYATLLAAYMAKESVTLRPVDSSSGCTIAYIAAP